MNPHTPTYSAWANMKQRCLNPNNNVSKYYKLKGITVCKKWLNFLGFLEDMGEKPKGYYLDRIDPNGNYCKENCRWVNVLMNCGNRSHQRKGKYRGVQKKWNKYQAVIRINDSDYWLGMYKTPEEAAVAYNIMAIEWYGSNFSFINEIKKS